MLLTDVNDYPKVYNDNWLVLWENGPVIWGWKKAWACVSQYTEATVVGNGWCPPGIRTVELPDYKYQRLLDIAREAATRMPEHYPSLKGLQHATD